MRQMRMAAMALAVTLVLSGFALAHDDDDDDGGYYHRGNYSQARQYGYSNGYRDGIDNGRHEGRENDPYDYRTPDWRQATRGYQNWMGPVGVYQNAYRDGYRDGFQAGFQSANRGWGYGDGDRDDRQPVYNSWPVYRGYPAVWGGGNAAFNFGYQDGSLVAREDTSRGKPYNPNPRGKYDDADRGYRSEYGDKSAYRTQYASGYRAGYQAVFGRRY